MPQFTSYLPLRAMHQNQLQQNYNLLLANRQPHAHRTQQGSHDNNNNTATKTAPSAMSSPDASQQTRTKSKKDDEPGKFNFHKLAESATMDIDLPNFAAKTDSISTPTSPDNATRKAVEIGDNAELTSKKNGGPAAEISSVSVHPAYRGAAVSVYNQWLQNGMLGSRAQLAPNFVQQRRGRGRSSR